MNLNESWNKLRQDAHTETVLMTVSDIINFYSRGRINIQPEYQRTYRWTNVQKTKFIESVLLKYPIPPIITIKTVNENTGLPYYEIIDGVQRLSTIFEFANIKDKKGNLIASSNQKLAKLIGAKVFKEINGKDWQDFKNEEFDFTFESSSILFLNFSSSDDDKSVEIFERLNSNATPLSPQEIRNSILALKGRTEFYTISEKVKSVSKFINKNDLAKRLDMEYFLKFSLIKRYDNFKPMIDDLIKEEQKNKSKDKENHINLMLSSYAKIVKIEELKEDIKDYEEFLIKNSQWNFKKFDNTTNNTSGLVIKFFFEVLAFIFFKNKDIISHNFYITHFSRTYEDIMRNDMDRNNPNAKTRFEISKLYAERLLDEQSHS